MSRRYTVHEVSGYRITRAISRPGGQSREGLTAYVVDEANGRELGRFRSESAPQWTPDRRQWARDQARALARELNDHGC